ncbi:MAG: GAF domain-containing protein, partial [Nitriliruptoraceae bacterium]
RVGALAAAGGTDVTTLLAAVDRYLDTEIARVRRFGSLGIPPWDDLLVAAASAAGDAPLPHGHRLEGERSYGGFVIETSQPVALELRAGDDRAHTELATLGTSSGHLLAVPCVFDDACLGVLEVVAGEARGRFDLDDVELVTLLGSVAGAAIHERLGGSAPPTAEALATELRHLAASDPGRFATVSRLVAAVLGP